LQYRTWRGNAWGSRSEKNKKISKRSAKSEMTLKNEKKSESEAYEAFIYTMGGYFYFNGRVVTGGCSPPSSDAL
jgi:hypothetical protein